MARPKKRSLEARVGRQSSEALEATAPAEALLSAPLALRIADEASAAISSPARALQAELAASFAENAQPDRLPPAPLVLALGAGSLMIWMVVAFAVRSILV